MNGRTHEGEPLLSDSQLIEASTNTGQSSQTWSSSSSTASSHCRGILSNEASSAHTFASAACAADCGASIMGLLGEQRGIHLCTGRDGRREIGGAACGAIT